MLGSLADLVSFTSVDSWAHGLDAGGNFQMCGIVFDGFTRVATEVASDVTLDRARRAGGDRTSETSWSASSTAQFKILLCKSRFSGVLSFGPCS